MIKTERDRCQGKERDAELKLKELDRLKIALERKTESDVDDFKSRYEREREMEKRGFDAKRRQLEEDEHIFKMNKDRFLANETTKVRLEKENVEIRNERDELLRSNNEIKDQLRVLSQNALRDSEIIQSKSIEAKASTDEAKTYKNLLEETRK